MESFEKIMDKVFDSFKKISPALVAIMIMTGSILFLPISILEKLGLNNLDPIWRTIIGLLFLLSCSLILTILLSSVFQKVLKKIKYKNLRKKLRKSYIQLSLKHKKIIIKMMTSSSKSIELDSTSGDTIYLVDNNFIFMPQQAMDIYSGEYIYAPQPWLVDLFEKEHELFNTKK